MIRTARAADFEVMQAIECAAGEAFRGMGMARIADDPPATVSELTRFLAEGQVWVQTGEDDEPVAYLLSGRLDGRAHIEQVTVHPDYARRGIGAALIEAAAAWAREQNLGGLSLTTFAEVPWNAPYYSRLGFSVLPNASWTSGLRQRVAIEAANGLSDWPRVVMVRR